MCGDRMVTSTPRFAKFVPCSYQPHALPDEEVADIINRKSRHNMIRTLLAVFLGLGLLIIQPSSSFADGPDHHFNRERDFHHHEDWHHRRFDDDEWQHHGHWHRGDHDGRFGWWWIIGSNWYFYPTPTYPYPPRIVVMQPTKPYCRQFHGDATIDASGQPFYGTACFESDGRWHIVP